MIDGIAGKISTETGKEPVYVFVPSCSKQRHKSAFESYFSFNGHKVDVRDACERVIDKKGRSKLL